MSNLKIGFVCLMHKCANCSRNSFIIINSFIKTLYTSCKNDFILYLFDNGSDELYEVPTYPNIKYTRIEDQTIRGLAGPYNDGIKMAVEDNCDLIILINDDVILNNSINNFIDIVLNHEVKDIGLYGPLSNGLHVNSHQLAEKAGIGIREITHEHYQFADINGFIMAFTPEFYHLVKLENGNFCDMRYKWGGGEEIMQDRARGRGARMFIIKDCWFYHKRISEWTMFEQWTDSRGVQ